MRKFKYLSEFLSKYGLELTEKQEVCFSVYFDELVETNKFLNLTAITEFEEVEEKHFMDSLAAVSFFDFNSVESLVDIGTGAGFPGLPIKIMFPHLRIILADSLNKRVNFLNSLIEKLKLSDITAVHGRAEELARDKEYRENFDVCVSRAVSSLPALSELCLPLVKTGGYFIPYKSQDIDEEVKASRKAIKVLGGELIDKKDLVFGNAGLCRSFPIIKKIEKTPDIYPRKNGTPQKKPIK